MNNQEPQLFNFLINTSHYTGSGKYRLNLPSNLTLKPGDGIRISSYCFYNSIYNISSALANNTFSIKWIDNTVYNYVIPDGYYSFNDLNTVIQYFMTLDNLYVVSTSTSTSSTQTGYYFISCNANIPEYTAELNILYVPTSMTGYAIPSGATWSFPTSPTYPQITLSDGLKRLFGFKSQSVFPTSQDASSLTNLLFKSEIYSKLSPTFNFNIGSNLIFNKYSNLNPHIFQIISIDNSYGLLLKSSFSDLTYYSTSAGVYSYIDITFYDTDLNPVDFVDPEMALTLTIRISAQNVN